MIPKLIDVLPRCRGLRLFAFRWRNLGPVRKLYGRYFRECDFGRWAHVGHGRGGWGRA